jgi:hypothetical protein
LFHSSPLSPRLDTIKPPPPMSQSEPQHVSSDVPTASQRERLRFVDLRTRRTLGNALTVEVELEWEDGVRVCGSATGQSSAMADLRIAADAVLRAMEAFTTGVFLFELIGVKVMRAFDTNVVIVAADIKRGDRPRRVLGAVLAEDDTMRGAALATLNATNRVIGSYIATR